MNSDRHYNNFKSLENWFGTFDLDDTESIFTRALDDDERVMLWLINDECNLNCEYCHNIPHPEKQEVHSMSHIVNCFERSRNTWLINISGGEPFLYSDFTGLVEELTKKHYLFLNTNLSSRLIPDFARRIPFTRIPGINASYHAGELGKHTILRDQFIENYLSLARHGFNIIVSYVAFPPYISKIASDIEFLKSQGIIRIGVRNFTRMYEGRKYPESYTSEEKKIIREFYDPAAELDIDRNFTSLKGRKCLSGYRYFFMDPHGNVTRCTSAGMNLGNFFQGNFRFLKKPLPCPADQCVCAFEGLLCSSKAKRSGVFFNWQG